MMKMMKQDVYNWSYAVLLMLESLIETETPFFVIIDTDDINWKPALPETLRSERPTALFHIAGDSLMDSTVQNDTVTLRIAIVNNEGISMHDYTVDSFCRIKGLFESVNNERAQPIYIMPEKLEEAINRIDEEESNQLHTLNHFLKNPDNAKFFK